MNRIATSPIDHHVTADADARSTDTALRVLMIGEGLERQGGIVTVQRHILHMADDDLTFSHIATLKDGSTADKVRNFVSAIGKLVSCLVRERVDVVHIHVSIGGSVYRKVIAGGIALLAGKPLIMHAHAGEFPEFFARQPAPVRWLTRLVFRRAARLVALSDHWRRVYSNLIGLAPERLTVLANPIVIPETVPSRTGRTPTRLLYLGRMSEPKGAFDLIHAIEALPEEMRSRLHLTIAGDGETQTAKDLVRSLDLDASITIRDWVGPAERDGLLADADIFLLPSYFEGMPMALLEAMSWGLACVTTPVGGIPDVIQDGVNGVLVPPGDRPGLAHAIERLAGDADYRLALGEAARNDMQPYTVERYALDLRKLYAELTPNSATV